MYAWGKYGASFQSIIPHNLAILPSTLPVKLVSSATSTLLVDSIGDVYIWSSGTTCQNIESQLLGKLWEPRKEAQVIDLNEVKIPETTFELLESVQGEKFRGNIAEN